MRLTSRIKAESTKLQWAFGRAKVENIASNSKPIQFAFFEAYTRLFKSEIDLIACPLWYIIYSQQPRCASETEVNDEVRTELVLKWNINQNSIRHLYVEVILKDRSDSFLTDWFRYIFITTCT